MLIMVTGFSTVGQCGYAYAIKGDIKKLFKNILILCVLNTFDLGTCLSKTKLKYTHRLKRYGAVFE